MFTIVRKALGRVRKILSERDRRARFHEERAIARETARAGRFPFVMVLDGLKPAVNPGHVIRSADAFGARAVYGVGIEYFEVGTTVGSLRNVPYETFARFHDVHQKLRAEGYTFYALEPLHDLGEPRYLDDVTLAEKAAFVVGHEKHGIRFRPADYPDVEWIAIRQFGTVPCLNVSHATTVAMYEYTRQHGRSHGT